MPNANAPKAPWVEVCESPQTMVVQGKALLGSHNVHNALAGVVHPVERNTKVSTVFRERLNLQTALRVCNTARPVLGRHIVIRYR